MGNYRPITDMWILARAKLKDGRKYYGAYLGGFPERARALLGCSINDPVLHVCGGMARYYPYARGFGPLDCTLDIDVETKPDFCQDAREPFPCGYKNILDYEIPYKAYLIDPPYTEQDAEKYSCGSSVYPKPNVLVKNGIDALSIGGRVGIIHYVVPKCPKNAKFIACVGVICGFNNRIRVYCVYEKIEE